MQVNDLAQHCHDVNKIRRKFIDEFSKFLNEDLYPGQVAYKDYICVDKNNFSFLINHTDLKQLQHFEEVTGFRIVKIEGAYLNGSDDEYVCITMNWRKREYD